VPLTFAAARLISPREIEEFEASHGIRLPAAYRQFLSSVGAGPAFIDRFGLGIEFHAPAELREFSSAVFTNAGPDPFPRILFFCSLTSRGDFGALDLRSETDSFAVFSHEENPSAWADAARWSSFAAWVIQLVDSLGESDLP